MQTVRRVEVSEGNVTWSGATKQQTLPEYKYTYSRVFCNCFCDCASRCVNQLSLFSANVLAIWVLVGG